MTAEKIPSWIEKLLLPKLSEMSGDIKAINARIDSLETNMNIRIGSLEAQIVSLRNEMNSNFTGVGYRFDAINTSLESLDNRIPVIEKITVLELKIADLEKRLAAA